MVNTYVHMGLYYCNVLVVATYMRTVKHLLKDASVM